MSLEKLRQNLVTCIKGISLLVPIFIKLIKWINNNIVKIKGGGKVLDCVHGRTGNGRSTCHPASMLLRSEPSNDPERTQICDRLNSLTTWIEGSHTFIVALAP